MPKELKICIAPDLLYDEDEHKRLLARDLGIPSSRIRHISLIRRSLDARRAKPIFNLLYSVWIDEEPEPEKKFELYLRDVSLAEPIIIVGAGPAGLFSALRLIELGFKPVVLERGVDVSKRRKDVAAISRGGLVNPDSNYCFGEGGAGTFSDGKLYTRSTKRGSTARVLNIFTAHGASKDILIDAHPHIGTNKLPAVISAISETIRQAGGEIHYGERVTEIVQSSSRFSGFATNSGSKFSARATILATGHSARDVLLMLSRSDVLLEAKPFALGLRIEHPQSAIDAMQYGSAKRHSNLPAASYALRTQVNAHGVFSFCMCPGGIICPAATAPGEVVVNGWSPSKRNSRFANSGIVVEIKEEDLKEYCGENPVFAGIELQKQIEKRAFELGGGNLKAPAERLESLLGGKFSNELPECSYHPGISAVPMKEVFPENIFKRLQMGLKTFTETRRAYLDKDAVVVATESRTSSPVRIPRDAATLMHQKLAGLFPCGEGAGYAGGIMSAAIDGERVAEAAVGFLKGE